MTVRLQPLTERILSRLPGARALWIATWALIPWANAGANLLLDTETSAVWEQRRLLIILNYAAISFAVILTLWGTQRIAQRLDDLGAEPFRAINNMVAPLLLASTTAVAFGISATVRDGLISGLLRGGTWLILGIAFWTFIWTYGCLLLGLSRLGNQHVRRDAALVDPGLGLLPVGAVAFMGLWLLLTWLVPILLTGLPDVVGVVIAVVLLVAALGAFFLSLAGLHRQMVKVKKGELEVARALYAEAYEPVRRDPSLETLERQQSLLGAADALEKRARAIHDWPIEEGTWAWLIGIATSVVAIACARLVLTPLGL
jgi:hypothetical protein